MDYYVYPTHFDRDQLWIIQYLKYGWVSLLRVFDFANEDPYTEHEVYLKRISVFSATI